MRPIDERTDVDFQQALRCVEYRLPSRSDLRPSNLPLALAVRYGVVGIAAAYHLLDTVAQDEEDFVRSQIRHWPLLVAEHVYYDVAHRLGMPMEPESGDWVGHLTREILNAALPLHRKGCPLEACLTVAIDEFTTEHLKEIRCGWNFYLKGVEERNFRRFCEDSVEFAVHFFERRRYDLEEVPEIALLGE